MSDERTHFAPRSLAPGEVIGNFRIVRLLGQGGSGRVYEARNVHNQDERVAIKIVLPDTDDRERFFGLLRAEANALLRVKHDAVVQYRTFGQIPDSDELYLVIEYVEGPTLGSVIKNKPLAAAELQRLASRLARGLGAAHEQGVIHRDLSPDNIVLPGGDPHRAAIIDFGVARNGAFDPLGMSFAGKFSFAAPEQLGGHADLIGPWTDLYSLGLVLAAAARGRRIAMGNSIASAKEARETVPDLDGVPSEFRPALSALLQPDPAQRPRSAEAAAALFTDKALRPQVIVRDPVMAAPHRPAEIEPPARRAGWTWAIGAGVLIAALGAVIAVLSGALESQTPVAAQPAPQVAAAPAPGPSPGADPSSEPAPPARETAPVPTPSPEMPVPADPQPARAPVLTARVAEAVARAEAADAEATAFAKAAADGIAAATRSAALAAQTAQEAEDAAARARAAAKKACARSKPPKGHGCYKTGDNRHYAGEAQCTKAVCTAEGFGVITAPDGASSLEGRFDGGFLVMGCLYERETRLYCGTLAQSRRVAGASYLAAGITQFTIRQWNDNQTGSIVISSAAEALAGLTYTGTWAEDELEGPAEVRSLEDWVQVAEFKGGEIAGSALTLGRDGRRYAAVFRIGATPAGRITFPDGSIYAGEVLGDGGLGLVAEGLGALLGSDETILKQGLWQKGALTEDLSRNDLRVTLPPPAMEPLLRAPTLAPETAAATAPLPAIGPAP